MTTDGVPHTAASDVTGATVFRRLESPRVEHVELDGESVVYEAARDRLHLLDVAATSVWRLLDGATSVHTVSCILAEAFGRSEVEIFRDVSAFAAQLEKLGIVERVT